MPDEIRVSFRGCLSEEGLRIHDPRVQTTLDIKTKKGREKLICLLLDLYGDLKTGVLIALLKNAGVHHRTRPTISKDLKSLIAQKKVECVKKGLYRSVRPLLQSHEKQELRHFVESCDNYLKLEEPKHPIGTTYVFSDTPRPKGLQLKFVDIGHEVLFRCVQNVLFSSYLQIAGQGHIPIAPRQLSGDTEIPKQQLERIWEDKAYKGKLLVAFIIDFQELHKYLETSDGRVWLETSLKKTPKDLRQTSKAIVKTLELIYNEGPINASKLNSELKRIGIDTDVANKIMPYILPYIETDEIDHTYYRINKQSLNIVRGLVEIESREDPHKVFELMKD